MARPLRMESQGGVYHVLNRGDQKADIFRGEKTRQAFFDCLSEACGKTGWRVHAWCLLPNAYHLAISTPNENLVEGMSWLQRAFASRFGALRGGNGHIFRDRYKSLVVDPDAGLGPLCHFIHLSPVLDGMCTPAELADYRWTSLAGLLEPKRRMPWFDPRAALRHAGKLSDKWEGRKKYLRYLSALMEDEPAREEMHFGRMSKGSGIGPRKFRKAVLRENRRLVGKGRKIAGKLRATREEAWQEELARLLRKVGRKEKDIAATAKSADWKLAVASVLKARTTVTNRWLSTALQMGNLYEVSRKVAAWTREPDATLRKKLG